MTSNSLLHNGLNHFLRQCPEHLWKDVRHLQWVIHSLTGIILSSKVNLSRWTSHVSTRGRKAQSKQRRFRRGLDNRRIHIKDIHYHLCRQALRKWKKKRIYLSVDTSSLWCCFCLLWVGVVYRGRTIPLGIKVVTQKSVTVRSKTVQKLLDEVATILPKKASVVVLADRGFADGSLMRYLRKKRRWHFRIRIKKSFSFRHCGRWYQVHEMAAKLRPGQAYMSGVVTVGKSNAIENVYLAFTHDELSGEFWAIISDERTNLQTFAQYQQRFQVEELID